MILYNEVTKILHGKNASKKAEQTAKDVFLGKGLSENLPIINVKSFELKTGVVLLDFLSMNKIVSSKSEARRLIGNDGLKLNDILLKDEKKVLHGNDFKNNILKISCGKKKHFLVKIIY